MDQAVQNAARALGLPESVVWNVMNLVGSMYTPPNAAASASSVLPERMLADGPAIRRQSSTDLLNSLIDEYDKKI